MIIPESSQYLEAPPNPAQIEQVNRTIGAFFSHYGSSATAVAIAPGRVNLIGEHIDYNGGCVLPAAIERWTVVAAAPCHHGRVMLHDARTGECANFEVTDLARNPQRSWTNYVRGVLAGFSRLGLTASGLNLTLHSTIPLGGGLSSSAALEAVIGKILCELFGWTMSGFDLAKLCQAAEHEYAGVPCGLMDQAAVILSRDNHLLLLDCASEEVVAHVPYAIADWHLMIINSGVAHELADGEYAKRRAVCQAAAKALGVSSLCHLRTSDLAGAGEKLSEEMLRCARHVLAENERTRR
jgi:galactokinase